MARSGLSTTQGLHRSLQQILNGSTEMIYKQKQNKVHQPEAASVSCPPPPPPRHLAVILPGHRKAEGACMTTTRSLMEATRETSTTQHTKVKASCCALPAQDQPRQMPPSGSLPDQGANAVQTQPPPPPRRQRPAPPRPAFNPEMPPTLSLRSLCPPCSRRPVEVARWAGSRAVPEPGSPDADRGLGSFTRPHPPGGTTSSDERSESLGSAMGVASAGLCIAMGWRCGGWGLYPPSSLPPCQYQQTGGLREGGG